MLLVAALVVPGSRADEAAEAQRKICIEGCAAFQDPTIECFNACINQDTSYEPKLLRDLKALNAANEG